MKRRQLDARPELDPYKFRLSPQRRLAGRDSEVKELDELPALVSASSHRERSVSGVFFDDYFLGAVVRQRFSWPESIGLLANPSDALRRSNPANLTAWDQDGRLSWVLPVSPKRLVLTQGESDLSPAARFRELWSQLGDAAGSMTDLAPIWGAGAPVGLINPELGATGTRPRGHPWLTLGVLESGLHLVCPLSARTRSPSVRSYQAWFTLASLRDVSGQQLSDKVDVLEPRDGAAELAHFAVVDPLIEGWMKLGNMEPGDDESDGYRHVASRFLYVWPQRQDGHVSYECEIGGESNDQCDDCSGRN